MKKIVIQIQPFDWQQKVYLFDDQELKMTVEVPLQELAARTVTLANQDGVSTIDLHTGANLGDKMREDMKDYQLTHYGDNNLTINIVSK